MAYTVIMEKDLEEKLARIQSVNFKEYTLFAKKVDEMKNHAPIMQNHRKRFNTFEKPLQEFKWVEINNKIIVFKLNPIKEEIHLCDYLPQDEVFE